jgi:hypothetical protein
MPESPSPRRRGSVWKLSNAHDVGQLACVQCQLCNIKRYYRPDDLLKLFGDVGIDDVRMRCEKCGHGDYIVAELHHMTATERASVRVRRLVEIRMVRKVTWRDSE